ncbi:hypothetical protein [Clostridium kluyveri]|uniref:Uncharacterized protein n=2 Tax=Clostridium kluyveri TaxID=1534 RepID=A5N4L5_CLOK5|nr:hypothetical protein [Clostridium kluyveri]EDK32246.1 Conserved hypothetical protein [Clostridium kluyveri DSM 555]BAH05202.1 hypothetical protein CKR_0151 [Clostridium kluyveri NBRC 12016]
MSKYKMNIMGKIALQDYSSIQDYMSIVNRDDDLTIIIDKNDDENIKIICNMLENKNFVISSSKVSDGNRHCIRAFKNID